MGGIIEELLRFVADKLKETVPAIDYLGTDLARIQTSTDQIHTAVPLLSAAALLVVVACICGCCCCGKGKTMKAPGGNGRRIRRQTFESNPRGYFASQRSRSHAD